MKTIIALIAAALCGCAVNRPIITERTIEPGGAVTEKTLKLMSFAIWPATQTIDKQRMSLGKTFSVGQSQFEQETSGTNIVEALRAIDSILGKIRP